MHKKISVTLHKIKQIGVDHQIQLYIQTLYGENFSQFYILVYFPSQIRTQLCFVSLDPKNRDERGNQIYIWSDCTGNPCMAIKERGSCGWQQKLQQLDLSRANISGQNNSMHDGILASQSLLYIGHRFRHSNFVFSPNLLHTISYLCDCFYMFFSVQGMYLVCFSLLLMMKDT